MVTHTAARITGCYVTFGKMGFALCAPLPACLPCLGSSVVVRRAVCYVRTCKRAAKRVTIPFGAWSLNGTTENPPTTTDTGRGPKARVPTACEHKRRQPQRTCTHTATSLNACRLSAVGRGPPPLAVLVGGSGGSRAARAERNDPKRNEAAFPRAKRGKETRRATI